MTAIRHVASTRARGAIKIEVAVRMARLIFLSPR